MFSPMLGGPKAATSHRMRLMHFATLTGVLLAAAWMIAQYCLQVLPYTTLSKSSASQRCSMRSPISEEPLLQQHSWAVIAS